MNKTKILNNFLKRTALQINFNDLLEQVFQAYNIGKLKSFIPIPIGYEDCNVELNTSKGKYVLKIFNKEKTLEFLEDYINIITVLENKALPSPSILNSKEGNLFKVKNQEKATYLCIMVYFKGKKMSVAKPTKKDINKLTKILAQIHRIKIRIHENYDSWGTANLIPEYEKRKFVLTQEEDRKIQKTIEKYQRLIFSTFNRSVIHGDIQREHVLKNKKGEYYLIDFGCLNYGVSVIDLAIFIALFVIDPSEDNLQQVTDKIKSTINEYSKYNFISKEEGQAINTLVVATYAVYLIRSKYEKIVNKDNSNQNDFWISFSKKGLSLTKDLQ
jgi:Ser/Thr protein kinase RdoA (MazF antagonist)